MEMSDSHGLVWWTELSTRDPDAARAYYGAICGWEWESMPMGDGLYWMGKKDGVPLVGVMDIREGFDGVPANWFSYFAVDDVDAACAATRAAGGRVIREPWDMPGTGRIAILEDPTGAAMGLMTPAPRGA
jgi:uncharacterized protein